MKPSCPCFKIIFSVYFSRFANALFSKVWNKDAVASVLISMKKKKLDDKEPILESLMHLLNLMSIVCFEEAQMEFTSERIYEARLKALRDIAPPAATADIVLGHIQRKKPMQAIAAMSLLLLLLTVISGKECLSYLGVLFKLSCQFKLNLFRLI